MRRATWLAAPLHARAKSAGSRRGADSGETVKTQQSTAQTSITTSTTESSPPSPHAAPHAAAPSTQRDQFLQILHEGLPGLTEVRAIHADTGQIRQTFHELIDDALVAVDGVASIRGFNVYVGVATRKPGATTGTKSDLQATRMLWVDIDCGTEEERDKARKLLRSALQPPSMIVNSGTGHGRGRTAPNAAGP